MKSVQMPQVFSKSPPQSWPKPDVLQPCVSCCHVPSSTALSCARVAVLSSGVTGLSRRHVGPFLCVAPFFLVLWPENSSQLNLFKILLPLLPSPSSFPCAWNSHCTSACFSLLSDHSWLILPVVPVVHIRTVNPLPAPLQRATAKVNAAAFVHLPWEGPPFPPLNCPCKEHLVNLRHAGEWGIWRLSLSCVVTVLKLSYLWTIPLNWNLFGASKKRDLGSFLLFQFYWDITYMHYSSHI